MRENPSLAAFAFLATATSGFGQTFFISVFGSGIRESFDLANSTYGLTYGLATLLSAALLLKAGPLADRWSVQSVTLLAVGMLAAGCLLIGLAPGWAMLIPGFLLARFGGQAMLSHIGMTVAGRYFNQSRGRIMALTAAGFPVAEATLPAAGGLILVWGGWRLPWFIAAGILIVLALPALLLLARKAAHPSRVANTDSSETTGGFSRAEALRDPGFYQILPAALAVPFSVTAMLFHQSAVADLRDWPAERVAMAFTGFAAGHLVSLFFAGSLVDRVGAQRALSIGLIPIFSGLLVLALTDSLWTPNIYLALTGVSLGCIGAAGGAIWPERYGARHIGAIRSVAQASMVFSTALSPILIGLMLDAGLAAGSIAGTLAVVIALCAILATTAKKPVQASANAQPGGTRSS
ncbi:MFS transporter [Marinobacter sp. ATCH36]|uniref:MFS transporter n=1 Tax=Marinobacter sp. ATCH36 TaxID=2945106 RepID=UPI002021D2FC|nr:MFS transporter [Marinobacter sp. ATCH36]